MDVASLRTTSAIPLPPCCDSMEPTTPLPTIPCRAEKCSGGKNILVFGYLCV